MRGSGGAFIGYLTLETLAVPAAAAQPARQVARIGLLSDGETTSDMIGPELAAGERARWGARSVLE